MIKQIFILSIVSLFVVLPASGQEIKVGQSAALSGPTQFLGKHFRIGLMSFFTKVNKEGGVKGLTISLETKDDKYEPVLTIKNTEALIRSDVFLIIGEIGTPTSKVAVPIIEQKKIPFLFPFTGAEFLRNPVKKYIYNYRASYYQETEALVERMTKDLGIKKIAAFIQNDAYGEAGLAGIKKALAKRNMSLAAEGRYKRNTMALIKGFKKVESASPDAVIMIGAYKPCAGFIKLAKRKNKNWVMANVSFVGSKAILKELGALGDKVVISQCVPFPFDVSVPIVKEYQTNLKAYDKNAGVGFVSLEGYIAGKLLFEILSIAACHAFEVLPRLSGTLPLSSLSVTRLHA